MYLANSVSDPKMIDFVWLFFFSFSRISDSCHQILWFCPDLEADLNFNGFFQELREPCAQSPQSHYPKQSWLLLSTEISRKCFREISFQYHNSHSWNVIANRRLLHVGCMYTALYSTVYATSTRSPDIRLHIPTRHITLYYMGFVNVYNELPGFVE